MRLKIYKNRIFTVEIVEISISSSFSNIEIYISLKSMKEKLGFIAFKVDNRKCMAGMDVTCSCQSVM